LLLLPPAAAAAAAEVWQSLSGLDDEKNPLIIIKLFPFFITKIIK
jgi:hypothetical protein